MTQTRHCHRCLQPLVANEYERSYCENCHTRAAVRPPKLARRWRATYWKGQVFYDYTNRSSEILAPYLHELLTLLTPQQEARLRHELLTLELDFTGTNYPSREYGLRILGYKDYFDYLRSDLYKAIRFTTLDEKGPWCVACGKIDEDGNTIHHRRYSLIELMGLDLTYLEPLCQKCHKRIEFDQDSKRSLKMANMQLDILQTGLI